MNDTFLVNICLAGLLYVFSAFVSSIYVISKKHRILCVGIFCAMFAALIYPSVYLSPFYLLQLIPVLGGLMAIQVKTLNASTGSTPEPTQKVSIHEAHKFLPQEHPYNVRESFIDGKVIVGQADKRLKTIPYATLVKNHTALIGPSGQGKGVQIQNLCYQALRNSPFDDCLGSCVVAFDPKDDEYLIHIMRESCEELNRPFRAININMNFGPQFNPFLGFSQHEVLEMLVAGLSVSERGDNSDYFKPFARDALNMVAGVIVRSQCNLKQALRVVAEQELVNTLPFEDKMIYEGVIQQCRELASVPCINAVKTSIDIQDIIDRRGVFYVIGSMSSPILQKVQRLLLVQICLLAKRRDRTVSNTHICCVTDELKALLSSPSLEIFNALRDKKLTTITAFQNEADLNQVSKDLSPVAAIASVMGNTYLKTFYRPLTYRDTEELSKHSGTILSEKKTEHRNGEGEVTSVTSVVEEIPRFSTNLIKSFRKGMALFDSGGPLLTIITTSPPKLNEMKPMSYYIKVEELTPPVRVGAATENKALNEGLIVDDDQDVAVNDGVQLDIVDTDYPDEFMDMDMDHDVPIAHDDATTPPSGVPMEFFGLESNDTKVVAAKLAKPVKAKNSKSKGKAKVKPAQPAIKIAGGEK